MQTSNQPDAKSNLSTKQHAVASVCFIAGFIQHHRCIGPHVDATNVCLELMLQPLPRSIPFFGGPSLPHLSSSSLACQVFSRIPQLPSAALATECVRHPFSWHDQPIAYPSFSDHLLRKHSTEYSHMSYVSRKIHTRQSYCTVVLLFHCHSTSAVVSEALIRLTL